MSAFWRWVASRLKGPLTLTLSRWERVLFFLRETKLITEPSRARGRGQGEGRNVISFTQPESASDLVPHRWRHAVTAFIAALALTACANAFAHKPSDSYLTIETSASTLDVQWDIALRDLDYALGLDANQDNALTWGEVRARHDDIAQYALARLQLRLADQICAVPTAVSHFIDDHSDGAYAVMRFTVACAGDTTKLSLNYRLFAEFDPLHKGLVQVRNNTHTATAIVGADNPSAEIVLGQGQALSEFIEYVKHGVWHIWIGFDHLLFLCSLLLPAVLLRAGGTWTPNPSLRASILDVVKVVTAFTIAHSITLSIAALGLVTLPSRWVESAIAASVVLAAVNNLYPFAAVQRWSLAFCFGLIHGFGFASVLADLGLPQAALLRSLIAFNVGVELGQLAVVAVFIPVGWRLRHGLFYRRAVLQGGSCFIALLAFVWLSERALAIKIL